MKSTVCVLLLLLAACSSASQSNYRQGAVATDQFNRESAECELRGEENRSTDSMGGLAGVASYYESYDRVYDACMRSKGYARTE